MAAAGEDTDYTSDEDNLLYNPGPWVPARIKGPLHEQILEQGRIIAEDAQRCIDTFVQKRKERPRANPRDLYNEAPFHSDALEVQQRLFEENARLIKESGEELEHKWEPTGFGLKVITIAEESKMIAALERKKAREEKRKRKMMEWNPDQSRARMEHKQKDDAMPKLIPAKQGQSSKYVPPKEGGGCTSCLGPCVLDSRRSLMSCTNEPMLPELMADLLGQFYRLGWMTGSGGAMAAISCDNRLLLSPSSLQKERIKACDLFASPPNSRTVRTPSCMPHGKPTACEGIFKIIMDITGAQCVIHSHSKASNLVTRLCSGHEWAISGQEYIKGIYNFQTGKNMENDDLLFVPIIENMPTEEELEPQVSRVLNNPNLTYISAILVRNHGVFVWGPTWQKTKIMTEIYDYLFELSMDLTKMGLPLVTQAELAQAVFKGQFSGGVPPNPALYAGIAAQNQLQSQRPTTSAPTDPPASPDTSAPSAPSAPPAE